MSGYIVKWGADVSIYDEEAATKYCVEGKCTGYVHTCS